MLITTAAENSADLAAQLAALQYEDEPGDGSSRARPKSQPRSKPQPDHIRRADHHHKPADTTRGCGQPMTRGNRVVARRGVHDTQEPAHVLRQQ